MSKAEHGETGPSIVRIEVDATADIDPTQLEQVVLAARNLGGFAIVVAVEDARPQLVQMTDIHGESRLRTRISTLASSLAEIGAIDPEKVLALGRRRLLSLYGGGPQTVDAVAANLARMRPLNPLVAEPTPGYIAQICRSLAEVPAQVLLHPTRVTWFTELYQMYGFVSVADILDTRGSLHTNLRLQLEEYQDMVGRAFDFKDVFEAAKRGLSRRN